MKKTVYLLLIVIIAASMIFNLFFDFDWLALVVQIGALAGIILLPKWK